MASQGKAPQRSRSCSAGLLLAAAAQLRQDKQLVEERHQRRIRGTSHGLYCRTLPPHHGSATVDRFWPLAQRELDRRYNSLDVEENSSNSDDEESEKEEEDIKPKIKMRSLKSYPSADREGITFIRGLQKLMVPTRAERAVAAAAFLNEEQTMLHDIREGLRVALLGRKPLEIGKPRVWPPAIDESATKEDALKVWKTYGEILDMARCTYVDPNTSFLMDMDWQSLTLWAEQLSYNEGNARYKSACKALLRGLKVRIKTMPEDRINAGVTLLTMMRWMWPSLSYKHAASMLSWICKHEIEKLRLPTPSVINDDARHQIESLFEQMDVSSKGYLCSSDLAGGDATDIMTQLKNCIDPEAVRVALGGGQDVKVDLMQFKELMCEDGFRGHPDAQVAVRADGRPIVYHVREPIEFSGWILRDTNAKDAYQWSLVEAVEKQMLSWRQLGVKTRARSTAAVRSVVVLNRMSSVQNLMQSP